MKAVHLRFGPTEFLSQLGPTRLGGRLQEKCSRVGFEYSSKFFWERTSTGLYRSCAALAHFSGTFDLILFEAVAFELFVEKVWFGLCWIDGLDEQTK